MKPHLKILLIVAFLGVIHYGEVIEHIRNIQDLYVFNDDSRQYIPPFYRYQNDGPVSEDYVADYYLQAMDPVGFRALYKFAAQFWDPVGLSKVLPYLEWAVLLLTLGIVSWKLGGAATCFATLALTLFSAVFFGRMAGALPRSFGFPLVSLSLAAVVFGRIYFLAIITVLGAALYPLVTVISGITLALNLVLLPSKYRGEAASWSYRRTCTMLAVTATLSFIVLLPQLQNGAMYGKRVLVSDTERFPEAGPSGRYGTFDSPPFKNIGNEALQTLRSQYRLRVVGRALIGVLGLRPETVRDNVLVRVLSVTGLVAVLIVIVGGFKTLAPQGAVFRLLMMVITTVIAHTLALIFFPYLYMPSRYVTYTVPLFSVLMIPVGFHGIVASVRLLKERASLITVTFAALFVTVFAGQGQAGYTVKVTSHHALYNFIATLPPDSVIAGWPAGIMDNVPYLSRRKAFLTFETHQVFHMKYMQEMRKRMIVLMDAYFGQDIQPLIDLHKRFSVDYLLVDQRHFAKDSPLNPPKYFAPFQEDIKKRLARAQGKVFVMSNGIDQTVIFRDGDILLLNLALLDQSLTTLGQ